MKYILGIASVLVLFGIASAQSCSTPPPDQQKSATFSNSFAKFTPANVGGTGNQTELTDDAKQFVRTGPKVFRDMNAAIAQSRKDGRGIACWVSEDPNPLAIFNDAETRKASADLDRKGVIQVAMGKNPTGDAFDRDGKRLGARVEFSDKNYRDGQKTAYIPVSKLNAERDVQRILAFTRGGQDAR